jgi:hypothetical protein
MSDTDRYRIHARYCLAVADRSQRPEDKQLWFHMAQTWLGMIPDSQRTAEDAFEAAVRDRGRGEPENQAA